MTFSKINQSKDRMPGKHFSEYAAFEMGRYNQIYWKRPVTTQVDRLKAEDY